MEPGRERIKTRGRARRVRVGVSPSALVVPFCLLLGLVGRAASPAGPFGRIAAGLAAGLEPLPWSAVIAASALHEGGHLLAAALCGVRVRTLRLDAFGARLTLEGLPSYRQEALTAFGGPAVNLLTVLLLLPHVGRAGGIAGGGWLPWFLSASAALCAVNLLPVRTLDGGRVFFCLSAPLLGDRAAEAALRVTTAGFLLLLWLLSVYALLRAGNMLSVFAFSLALLMRGGASSE